MSLQAVQGRIYMSCHPSFFTPGYEQVTLSTTDSIHALFRFTQENMKDRILILTQFDGQQLAVKGRLCASGIH